MDSPTTSGSHGQAEVGISTIASAMANWALPEQFRAKAVASVRLLVLAASEGVYSTQAFSFEIASGASLATLLVVATRMHSPSDPDLPIAVIYVTINTNAPIKQLYSYWTERSCHRCPKCVWFSRCCCHNYQRSAPRGHTPAEVNMVIQKMTADQYIWFNQQDLSPIESKTSEKRTVLSKHPSNHNINLTEAIKNYLSSNSVKAEILASYNDSIITAIQSNLTSLKLASEAFKFNKIQRENIPVLLMALAEDFGFDDIYSNLLYSQQWESPQFSCEYLFKIDSDVHNNGPSIRYLWILGQRNDNSTYNITFLAIGITSKGLIETMLSNKVTNLTSLSTINEAKQLNVVRISSLIAEGEFVNERLLTSITSWQAKTTKIVLNMLRFLGSSILVPQKLRMLSYFDSEVVQPGKTRNSVDRNGSENINNKLQALASSISSVLSTVKDIIQVFKSSKSVTIQRIVRFGFTYFKQKSTTLRVFDIPDSRTSEFVNALILDFNLPSKGSIMVGLTYSDDFAWDQEKWLYSPGMNDKYRYLALFKNGDSVKNTASFFIIDIDSDWNLAPDLLMITKSRSVLGGLWSSTTQSIQEVPHALTIDEAVMLEKFFMLVAIGNMASVLGLNATLPQLN